MLSTCPFVRYKSCEHDILKTNEPILKQISTDGPQGKGMKRSTWGVRRSRSQEAEVRFGGLGRVLSFSGFVLLCICCFIVIMCSSMCSGDSTLLPVHRRAS